MNLKRSLPLLCFLLGIASLWTYQFFRSYLGYPVEYLASKDRTHLAVVERNRWIDLNFRVILDGQPIYFSPDFKPVYSHPMRETLLWDDSERYLIFEVLGRRLFGYDVEQERRLSDKELLALKTTPPPIESYGFEDQWPGSNADSR
jgi:hypothetical protein